MLTSVHQPFDGRIFYREAVSLAKAGYAVSLLAPAAVDVVEKDGVTVYGAGRITNRLGRPAAWIRLFRLARRLHPRILHLHDPELLLLLPLFRLRFGRGVTIIYDVHEFTAAAILSRYWLPPSIRPLVSALFRMAEGRLISLVDAMVLAVPEQRPLYPRFCGSTAVVRNFPLIDRFYQSPPHPSLSIRGFKLIYAGLILPARGISVLLEAMRLLHKRGLDDVYLFLIGPATWPAYIRHIQGFCENQGLPPRVRYLGYVPHGEVGRYLAGADVGLCPRLPTRQQIRPGLQTKLFEYMLAGLPVIASDLIHDLRYVREAGCGLTAGSQAPWAWADAVAWLRSHPEAARAMGRRGQLTALSRHTWRREETQLLSLYQALSVRS